MFPFLPSQFHRSGTRIPGLASRSRRHCTDGKSNHDYSVYSWSIYTHSLIYCDELWKKRAQGTQKSVLQVDVKSVWVCATLVSIVKLESGFQLSAVWMVYACVTSYLRQTMPSLDLAEISV